MREKYVQFVKKLICSIFFGLFMIASTQATIMAEDNVNPAANQLTLTISYPSDIRCGEPVKFIMSAAGGSGNYKYRIAALMDSSLTSVYDISYGSNGTYKDSNEFEFTFYASGTYYVRFSVMDMTTNQTKMTGLYEYPIVIQDANYPSVDQLVNTITTQCEATCTTDFEKALWLHDWIIDHADYDYSYSYCSVEGVLARGKGTCESYHRAYEMLLNKVGIDTGRITGNGHVWTAVKMDGEWYQVDTTWDDMGASYKGTYYEHMYFGVNDYIIGLVHDEHTQPVAGYESTSLEDNYFIKTGEISKWSDQFIDEIKNKIDAGQKQFTISVTDSMPDNFKNVIYNLVAYKLTKTDWNGNQIAVSYSDSELVCTVVKSKEDEKTDGASVYDGIDYSAVYNYNYYVSHNPDIKAAFGEDDVAVLKHFVMYGMSEARQGTEKFDVTSYRKRYQDLRAAYGNDWRSYYIHYISYGRNEGRIATGNVVMVGQTVYDGVDYSLIYDYNYYVRKYADIYNAFGLDDTAALEHFVKYGMSEARQGCETFNVNVYRSKNKDLRMTFGSNWKDYYLHYISYGNKEGRVALGDDTITDGITIYNGVDYTNVYNYQYYIEKNPDVKKAFPNDDIRTLEHFIIYGMSEGRQANKEFNITSYRKRYADLRAAFGDDIKSYYLHYNNYGKSEGRVASGDVIMVGATIYDGVDYSSIYDYNYYVAKYPDIYKAFGLNDTATLEHFVKYGMSEARQGNELFNVSIYYGNYEDLRNAFGIDWKAYYLHYISYGKNEGRSAR